MQLNIFRIPAYSSSAGVKQYDFEIDGSFFANFDYGEIREGNLLANLEVGYSGRQVQIDLWLKGKVELPCDRCLESYEQIIDTHYVIVGKFGDGTEQDDLDVIWIPEESNYIDLVPVLYDFINISLPLKKVHPVDENGISLCNQEMINRLEEFGINDFEETE